MAVPLAALLGCSSLVATLVAYPAACWLLRAVGGWLRPWWPVLWAPVLWPLRHLVWTPSLWLCAPLAAYAVRAMFLARDRRVASNTWLSAALVVASW